MILNAKNVEPFITSGLERANRAQLSYDLTVANITRVVGGYLGKYSKTIRKYEEVDRDLERKDCKVWKLSKGEVYSITFEQNVKLDTKHCALIWHKSSVLRVAAQIVSGVYDPGFESSKGCGCELICHSDDLWIEEGTPLAQLLVFECQESESYSERGSYNKNNDLL